MEYKKRNRTDAGVEPGKMPAALNETELVLKLKKEELFDQHILLPHAELNKVVYNCVDTFVQKYKGDEMTLYICTNSVNPIIQDVFREVYRSHYEDEYKKVRRNLMRYRRRAIILVLVAVAAFIISSQVARFTSTETIFSYIIGNASCFCLWEVGYTYFTTRSLREEKKRIERALSAKIDFQ